MFVRSSFDPRGAGASGKEMALRTEANVKGRGARGRARPMSGALAAFDDPWWTHPLTPRPRCRLLRVMRHVQWGLQCRPAHNKQRLHLALFGGGASPGATRHRLALTAVGWLFEFTGRQHSLGLAKANLSLCGCFQWWQGRLSCVWAAWARR